MASKSSKSQMKKLVTRQARRKRKQADNAGKDVQGKAVYGWSDSVTIK